MTKNIKYSQWLIDQVTFIVLDLEGSTCVHTQMGEYDKISVLDC